MGYRPKAVQADALWFGIGIHEALAQWYLKGLKRGPHPADTFEKWVGEEIGFAKTYFGSEFEDGVWVDAKELGIWMLEEYIDFYGKDSDWEIIAVERPFSVRINRGGKVVAVFRSRWDGVLREKSTGRIFLLESKTASQINTAYLENDDQGGSYFAVATSVLRAEGVLKPHEFLTGVIYNFLRKGTPDDRPVNEEGLRLNKDNSVSKKQPAPLFRRELIERTQDEARTELERIADEVLWMNAVRRGDLPIIKTPGKDCPRCPFWDPCLMRSHGSEEALKVVLRQKYIQINPYEDDRKAA